MYYTVRVGSAPWDREESGPFDSPQEAFRVGENNWTDDHWWVVFRPGDNLTPCEPNHARSTKNQTDSSPNRLPRVPSLAEMLQKAPTASRTP